MASLLENLAHKEEQKGSLLEGLSYKKKEPESLLEAFTPVEVLEEVPSEKALVGFPFEKKPPGWELLPPEERERREKEARRRLELWELGMTGLTPLGQIPEEKRGEVAESLPGELPSFRVPERYKGVTFLPEEGKWINVYGAEVPPPPRPGEPGFAEILPERTTLGEKGLQFTLGEELGRPEVWIPNLLSGDPNLIREEIDRLAPDLAWLPLYHGRVAGTFLRGILKGVREGFFAPRKAIRVIDQLTGKVVGVKPSTLARETWEALAYPGKALWKAHILPSREGAKSLAEVFQPAVERWPTPLRRAHRTAQAARTLTMEKGSQLAARLRGMAPSEKFEVMKAVRGFPASKEAQALVKELGPKLSSYKPRKLFEEKFFDSLKRITRQTGPSKSTLSMPGMKAFLWELDDAVADKSFKEVRRVLKEYIEAPDLPVEFRAVARDLYNLSADTVTQVAKASRKAEMAYIVQKVRSMGVAKIEPKPGYLPSRSPFLRGLWVPRDVELELRAMEAIPRIANSTFSKYFMTPWKINKVILRPATFFRNVVSNVILNDWGGLPFYRLDYYKKAFREMANNGKYWQEWKRITGGGATFAVEETSGMVQDLRYADNAFDWALRHYNRFTAPFKKYYGTSEQHAKLAKYIWNKEHVGMRSLEAAEDAMKWTFNYGEVTRATAFTRAHVAPFFTWQSKVIPLMAETAVKHPWRLAKWILLYEALQNAALDRLDISDDEWAWIHSILPDYIREGQFLLLPWRDAEGRLQLLNLTYMIPGFGDLGELGQNPVEWLVANPIWQAAGAVLSNKTYSGAPLYYDWEPGTVKAAKVFSFLWGQWAPSLTPPGGIDWTKIWDTIHDRPDSLTPLQVGAMNVGFKITPIDPRQAARKHHALENIYRSEIGSQMRKALRRATSPEERRRIIRRYRSYRRNLNR